MSKPTGHMEIRGTGTGTSKVTLNGSELFVLADSLEVNANGQTLTTVTMTIAVETLVLRDRGDE